ARLQQALALNPDYRFFVLSYGTNDAANDQVPVTAFRTTMQGMITAIKGAGRTPIIPHIPLAPDGSHNDIPSYNNVIDQLTQTNALMTGPDLYGYFTQNTGLFTCPPCAGNRMTDDLHPDDDGLKAMNMLWSQAVLSLYQ
ncbi:MAG: SGNH/GDSL hydrolase family protein, partial [Myxococcales bacterium]|nr:SGNH/GDSL hydrolase family protein [Myxococcales bacterium]